jgi:copper homeostasis protein
VTDVEICLDDVAGARAAEAAGADRIEVCTDLADGGVTPSLGLIRSVLGAVTRVGVQVLIRPRPGDFVYDADEVDVMVADVEAITALPARVPVGFVLNALTADGRVDEPVIARLVAAAGGAPTTFSRAFDETADPTAALDQLVGLGLDRVLTGGGPGRADVAALADLVARAAGRIGVLAAGGIRSATVAGLVAATGVREVHLRAPVEVTGRMRTDEAEVRAVISSLSAGPARS